MHVAMHTSILTTAGTRWLMAFDVVVMFVGSFAVLLEMIESLGTRARPNFRHCSMYSAHIGRVPIYDFGRLTSYVAEAGTRIATASLFGSRLSSSSTTVAAARPPAASQLSLAVPHSSPDTFVSTRPPSQPAASRWRLRFRYATKLAEIAPVPIHTILPPDAPPRRRQRSRPTCPGLIARAQSSSQPHANNRHLHGALFNFDHGSASQLCGQA